LPQCSADGYIRWHGFPTRLLGRSQNPMLSEHGFAAENDRLHHLHQQAGQMQLFRDIMKEQQDYLNQVSTQATLLATASCYMLGSKEQIIFKETRLCDIFPSSFLPHVRWACEFADTILELSYVWFAAVSFGLALSVVYGAMKCARDSAWHRWLLSRPALRSYLA
jgi:hypothetical protein